MFGAKEKAQIGYLELLPTNSCGHSLLQLARSDPSGDVERRFVSVKGWKSWPVLSDARVATFLHCWTEQDGWGGHPNKMFLDRCGAMLKVGYEQLVWKKVYM